MGNKGSKKAEASKKWEKGKKGDEIEVYEEEQKSKESGKEEVQPEEQKSKESVKEEVQPRKDEGQGQQESVTNTEIEKPKVNPDVASDSASQETKKVPASDSQEATSDSQNVADSAPTVAETAEEEKSADKEQGKTVPASCLNCTTMPPVIECLLCKSFFCQDCEDEIHQGPVLSKHERVKI